MVAPVLQAVCAVKGTEAPDWPTVQRLLAEPGFTSSLVSMDCSSISDAAIRQLRKALDSPDATPAALTKHSPAAAAMCQWAAAMEKWHVAMQTLGPMQDAVTSAQASVQQLTEQLDASKAQAQVTHACCALPSTYCKHGNSLPSELHPQAKVLCSMLGYPSEAAEETEAAELAATNLPDAHFLRAPAPDMLCAACMTDVHATVCRRPRRRRPACRLPRVQPSMSATAARPEGTECRQAWSTLALCWTRCLPTRSTGTSPASSRCVRGAITICTAAYHMLLRREYGPTAAHSASCSQSHGMQGAVLALDKMQYATALGSQHDLQSITGTSSHPNTQAS